MNSTMLKSLVLAFALLFPTASSADWTGNQTIKELFVTNNAVVMKLNMHPSATGCSDNSYLTLEPDNNPLFKEKYAMLLAAKTSGKPVDVLILGCGTAQPLHPKVNYVRMMP